LQLRPISPTCLAGFVTLEPSRPWPRRRKPHALQFWCPNSGCPTLNQHGMRRGHRVTLGMRRNYEVGICEILGSSFMGRCSPVGAERLWRWRRRWLRCVPSADHRAALRPELSDGGRNCLSYPCDQTATDSGVQIRDAGLFISIATRTTSAS
jgi:hypothetical protein